MEITVPVIELPFEIPLMLHPLLIHFLVAIPIVVLLLEIINLFGKSKLLGGVNFFLLFLTSILLYAAYITGNVDAKSADIQGAKDLLAMHKEIGIYLLYGSFVVLLFKLISMLVQKGQIRFFYLLLLVVFDVILLNNTKNGTALVYKYGVNPGKTVHKVKEEKSTLSNSESKSITKEHKQEERAKQNHQQEQAQNRAIKPEKESNTSVSHEKEEIKEQKNLTKQNNQMLQEENRTKIIEQDEVEKNITKEKEQENHEVHKNIEAEKNITKETGQENHEEHKSISAPSNEMETKDENSSQSNTSKSQ